MIIHVEESRQLKSRLREINSLRFGDIDWHENGQPINTHPQVVDDWKLVGMNNADFIDTEFYKETPESLAQWTETVKKAEHEHTD